MFLACYILILKPYLLLSHCPCFTLTAWILLTFYITVNGTSAIMSKVHQQYVSPLAYRNTYFCMKNVAYALYLQIMAHETDIFGLTL